MGYEKIKEVMWPTWRTKKDVIEDNLVWAGIGGGTLVSGILSLIGQLNWLINIVTGCFLILLAFHSMRNWKKMIR